MLLASKTSKIEEAMDWEIQTMFVDERSDQECHKKLEQFSSKVFVTPASVLYTDADPLHMKSRDSPLFWCLSIVLNPIVSKSSEWWLM